MKKKEQYQFQNITYANQLPACTPNGCTAQTGPESDGYYCIQDVEQGSLLDCYFMAALASVAWADPGRLGNFTNGYKFKNDSQATMLPDKKAATYNGSLCYARIGPRGFIWPLLYERAYAIWRGCGDPCTSMSCIQGGAGMQALEDITGYNPSPVLQPSTWTAASIPNNNGFASVAAVAWTSAGDPANKIPSNHTFSYLGHYPAINPAYIILRNPHGRLAAEPSTNVTQSNIAWYSHPKCPINFSTKNDGIFALAVATFKSKFAGMGYVRK